MLIDASVAAAVTGGANKTARVDCMVMKRTGRLRYANSLRGDLTQIALTMPPPTRRTSKASGLM